MRPPPRFAAHAAELDSHAQNARQWACPHCRQTGWINGHGRLLGLDEAAASGKTILRGRRFLCSARGRRRGCGHTFSVVLATVLTAATVRTVTFWRFAQERLGGKSVAAAWEGCGGRFSLEAAYGWWRRWARGEPQVRTVLLGSRAPPLVSVAAELARRYGATDPIAGFQQALQRPFC